MSSCWWRFWSGSGFGAQWVHSRQLAPVDLGLVERWRSWQAGQWGSQDRDAFGQAKTYGGFRQFPFLPNKPIYSVLVSDPGEEEDEEDEEDEKGDW